MKRGLLLTFAVGLIVLARLWNWQQVFVDGNVYFVDADCYSRMTRVAAVFSHPGIVLRHHNFENWPVGTTPHTTALLDYIIAGLAGLLAPISDRSVDLAGAWTPIVLAVASGFVLWKWARPFRFVTQIAILLTFAISPILVHGTVLGRPDHQALLIFLIIIALATEWEMQKPLEPLSIFRLPILNGLAWGLALWTSLFEPVILLLCCVVEGIIGLRGKWFTRARAVSALSGGSILLLALIIEHWRIQSLPTGQLFERWSRSIGELAPVGWWSPVYIGWVGLSVLAIPAVMVWHLIRQKNLHALLWLALLTLTYVLSAHAARWGYFFAITCLFTLPFLLEKIRHGWLFALFFLAFWPIASEWDTRLWPSPNETERLAEQREDYRQLRKICEPIRQAGGGVIAPWWLSPPIAYWSGANCVAGSSHQSLPGIEDVAQFYISRFPEKSRDILRRRDVRWVVAYKPDRILATASSLLNMPAARDAFAVTLYQAPSHVPPFLRLTEQTQFFKLYHVKNGL